MNDVTTHSLSEFRRNSREHVERLKATGQPEVLTVDGQPELVVQSADAYQKLLDLADQAESVAVLRQRIAAADAGEAGIPASDVIAEIRQRLARREG